MECLSYDPKRHQDRAGRRWHFMRHRFFDDREPDERPFALFFRDDERTEFGVLRFERAKDNPYRSYEVMIRKIMNDEEFRASLLDKSTKRVWRGR